jgi:hypothetical protein
MVREKKGRWLIRKKEGIKEKMLGELKGNGIK